MTPKKRPVALPPVPGRWGPTAALQTETLIYFAARQVELLGALRTGGLDEFQGVAVAQHVAAVDRAAVDARRGVGGDVQHTGGFTARAVHGATGERFAVDGVRAKLDRDHNLFSFPFLREI